MIVTTGDDTTWHLIKPQQKEKIADKGTRTIIDPEIITLDRNRYNNFTQGKFPNKPLKFRLLPQLFNFKYNTVVFTPIVYYRKLDGLMPGIVSTNYTLPFHTISYLIGGFYGIGTHKPLMITYLLYQRPPINGVPMIGLGLYADNFAIPSDNNFARIRRLAITLKLGLWNKNNSDHWHKNLKLGYVRLQNPSSSYRNVLSLRFYAKKTGKFHPAHFKVMAMQIYDLPHPWSVTNPMNIFTASFSYTPLHYVSLNTGLHVRAFFGFNSPLMAMTNQTDFDYSQPFVSHYDTSSFFANQVAIEYGAFMLRTPHLIYPWYGGMNITTTLPFKKIAFLQAFFDMAYTQQDKLMYEGGVKLTLATLDIYVPLFANDMIKSANPGFNPFRTVRFAINLNMQKMIKM